MNLVRSFLHARAHPGQRATLVHAFKEHRILDQCAEAVPGCLEGQLLLSVTDPEALCVTVLWASQADHEAWMTSPVRVVQSQALGAYVAESLPPVLMRIALNWQPETRKMS